MAALIEGRHEDSRSALGHARTSAASGPFRPLRIRLPRRAAREHERRPRHAPKEDIRRKHEPQPVGRCQHAQRHLVSALPAGGEGLRISTR